MSSFELWLLLQDILSQLSIYSVMFQVPEKNYNPRATLDLTQMTKFFVYIQKMQKYLYVPQI